MQDGLSESVDAELSRRSDRLRFEKTLEARFEADTQRQRSLGMLAAALFATPVYFLFLANDYNFRSEIFDVIMTLRIGALLLVALPIFILMYKGVTPFWRETLMSTLMVVTMCVSCWVLRLSTAPYSYYDVFSFGLILLTGNTFFPLRFVYACVASVMCIVIMLATMSGYEPMPSEAKNLALLTLLTTALFTLVICYRLERNERRAYLLLLREKIRSGDYQRDNQKLSLLSMTDPLTNLANRRQFDTMLNVRWYEAREQGSYLGLLVIDVDHFKAYNDYLGHLQGDECLRQVAASMGAESREDDLVARFGGEEFVLLITHATPSRALQAAERIRQSIEALQIPHPGCDETDMVTVSVGVSTLYPARNLTPIDLLAQADAALYKAKQYGRNRTWVSGAGEPMGTSVSAVPRFPDKS